MNLQKEKCKKLKEIRKNVADSIGVDLHQTECTYEGVCKGTCPKCAQEERQLNQALLGRAALVTGVAAMSIGLAGCQQTTTLEGDAAIVTEAPQTTEDIEGGEDWSSEELTTETGTEIRTEAGTTEEGPGEIQELEGDVVYLPEEEE